MQTTIRFILIDDDYVNNLYCSIIIQEATGEESDIKTFDIPEKGFEYITNEYSSGDNPTVLLLDINMPTWSGWEFLDGFGQLGENIKKQVKIYILSSSLDPADHQRAEDNPYVMAYIEKPLSEPIVLSILEEQRHWATDNKNTPANN